MQWLHIVQEQSFRKVAELLQKSQEFAKFFSTKPRRFSLYVSLLTGKGHYLLAAYLEKELSKRNLSIQAVFLDKKAVLEEQLGHTENVNSFNAAKKKRDISVLVTVILVCFKDTLDPRVKKAIAGIHEAYLGYARLALKSLDVEKFSEIDGDLVNNLRILSWDLGADIVLECEEFINNHRLNKRESTPDTDDDFDLLKSHGLKLKTLEDVYNETLNQLKEVMKKMEERGIPFKRDYVLQLQLMTYGEKKAVVEDILTTVFAAALRHNESTDEYKDIREEVDHILDQIKAITGVTVETVERHCILISIRCSSSLGLLKLIEYVESTFFQEMLYKLSTVLIASFEEVLVVTGNFNFETLHGLANYLSYCFEKEHEQGGLTLPISCSSVEGVNQVLRLMAADTAKHSVKNVAEQLSKRVGDKVTLQVKFPDLEQCFGVTEDNVNYLSTPHIETSHYDPANDTNDKDTSPTVRSERFEGCVIYKKSLTVIKKSQQSSTFKANMGNELSLWRIEDKQKCQPIQGEILNNFASIALSLKYTTDLVHEIVDKTMKAEYDSWPVDFRDGFINFMGKADQVEYIDRRNRQKDGKAWKLKYNDKTAEKILDTIVSLHKNPKSEHFNWKSDDNSAAQPYWVLAKIFMPFGNELSAGVESADPLSILTLLKNCRLFEDFDEEEIDKVIDARNLLMHSVPQYISTQIKKDCLNAMIKFLQLPPLKLVSGRMNVRIQLERVRDGDVVVCDALPALKNYFEKWLPCLSESEILETANEIKDNLKDTLETILTAQTNDKKKQRLETVGGVVGVISTGATTGAAGGGVTALAVGAVGAVAVVAGATVAAPAIIAGGVLVAGVTGVSSVVGGVIGWIGGSAGGRAVGNNIRE